MSTATISPVHEPAHTEVPPETLTAYTHTLTAMRSHYKATGVAGQVPHPYAIPTHLLHPIDARGVLVKVPTPKAAVKQQVTAMMKAAQTSTDNEVNGAHTALNQALSTLSGNKNLDAFHNTLEQQRTALKQKADAAIDKAIDTAEAIGKAHPEAISVLVQAVQKIGTFFSGMASSIYNFFKNLVSTIVHAIKAAVEWLEKAGKSVAQWASGIVSGISSVVSIVEGLF